MHVHYHTLLQSRGGTARVAHELLAYLAQQGVSSSHSYEVQDCDNPGLQLSPKHVVSDAPENNISNVIHHLHASLDWPACLDSFSTTNIRPIITLHDCKLITGGCAFPLNCEQWKTGCTENCPQHLQHTKRHWRNSYALLRDIRPWLTTPSNWLAKMLLCLHPDALCRVIPNGIAIVESIQVSKGDQKKRIGVHPKSKVVLFIAHGGMQAGYKGGHLWKKIWVKIKAGEPHAVALAIGGNHLRRNKDFLEFPYLDKEHLARCINAADVLVYPSMADNHPLVILEAMACGLPCVAFAVGGIPEQLVHERTGLLATPGNAESLATLALRVLHQPRLGEQLSSQALIHFNSFFTRERMGRGYLDVYTEMITERS